MDTEIFLKVRSIIDKIAFFEKKNYLKFEDVSLHPAEIHIILYIEKNKKLVKNITKISKDLKVTKGAVSQNISRLEKKGILLKNKDPYHKNELSIFFTKKGERAVKKCAHVQNNFQKACDSIVKKFSQNDQATISKFLSELEKVF